ncbi:MAG: CARDB domain-containing protein [Candidatus Bathyarchaeia archaeon]
MISETLVSVDDPYFGDYDPLSGNGTIAKIIDVNGVKYFQSLAGGEAAPPSDDYMFRYLTRLPEVDATRHWKLHFRHYVVNLGDADLENCVLDGWHSYLIAPGGSLYGNLWRLYKYNASSPTLLKAKTTIKANASYIIHDIPSGYRVTFIFSFKTGDAVLDSWVEGGVIGREIIKFKGPNYTLPVMELSRIRPGTVKLTPPRLIEYNFNVVNLNETSSLNLRLEYKFGETTVWEMQLWPSGNQGEVGSTEFTLEPLAEKSFSMSLLFPEDKDDHGVLVYFGILILSGREAPPLKGEIWENLYGVNSYLGIKQSWITTIVGGRGDSRVELSSVVAPYVSPFSLDILPYEHYLEVRVFDGNHRELIYGPVRIVLNGTIRKGDELLFNYTIPVEELAYRSGRYIAQIDTYRRGLSEDMNLARLSIPFHLSLPDLRLRDLNLKEEPKIRSSNTVIVTLENVGEYPADDFKVGFYVDDALMEERVASLKPGEAVELSFNWTPRRDRAKLTVKADIDQVLPEGRLEDNQVSRLVIIGGGLPRLSPYIIIALTAILAAAALALHGRGWPRRRGNGGTSGR